jgi:hypothetical protein
MNSRAFNEKIAIHFMTGVLIAALSGFFGYRVGHSYSNGKSGGRYPAEECMGADLYYRTGSPHGLAGSHGDAPDGEYYTLLRKNKALEEKDRKLLTVIAPTELGRALVQTLTLHETNANSSTPEAQLLADNQKLLESTPQETLALIHSAMKRLVGTEFAAERQYLIRFVGRLDLDIQEKTNFLVDEMVRAPLEAENKQTQLSNVVALTTLIQLEVDSTLIEGSLRPALTGALPYSLRMILLSVFESRFPEQGRKIREDLGV